MGINEFLRFITKLMNQSAINTQLSFRPINSANNTYSVFNSDLYYIRQENNIYYKIPRLHCKNDFSFEIDLTEGFNTENGFEKLGNYFTEVKIKNIEGDIDDLLKNNLSEDNIINVNILNGICFKKGGIDLSKTMSVENLKNFI